MSWEGRDPWRDEDGWPPPHVVEGNHHNAIAMTVEITSSSLRWGYEDVVREGINVEIVLSQMIGDYQGDWLMVVRRGAEYGWLTFGYGSCSGCDELQAVGDIVAMRELRDRLAHEIHWEPSKEKFVEWMVQRDWQGQWFWREEEAASFVERALTELGA